MVDNSKQSYDGSSKQTSILELSLWSFLRAVLSQGGDIYLDHRTMPYELYSARLDAAARERGDELEKALQGSRIETPGELARLREEVRIWECRAKRAEDFLDGYSAAPSCAKSVLAGEYDYEFTRSSVEPPAECDHPRSELLASKGDQFEMRKCLECTKIFRVRLREKASDLSTYMAGTQPTGELPLTPGGIEIRQPENGSEATKVTK